MSVLRYYVCMTYVFGSLVCNINLISDLCLVLCCDIYRSTLISVMYPACMITVHDRISGGSRRPRRLRRRSGGRGGPRARSKNESEGGGRGGRRVRLGLGKGR